MTESERVEIRRKIAEVETELASLNAWPLDLRQGVSGLTWGVTKESTELELSKLKKKLEEE